MPKPDDSPKPTAPAAPEPSPPYPPWQTIKAKVSADLPDHGVAPAVKGWTDLVAEDEPPKQD